MRFPGSVQPFAIITVRNDSITNSCNRTQDQGRSTVAPAREGACRIIARIAVPIWRAVRRPKRAKPPSPPFASDFAGISTTNKTRIPTEPTHNTRSVTWLWSRKITNAVKSAAKIVNVSYRSKNDTDSVESPKISNRENNVAPAIKGIATLSLSTPLTMRYEPPNAPAREVTIPNAYPESSRLDATAINAPIIPKEIDTPQSPG